MSTSCGFFNSLNGDRKYNASQFGKCFEGIIRDGILASIGDCFVVKAAGGMNITIGSGKAWYLASWLENDADLPMAHEDSDVILGRIDAVVMEFNATETVRFNDVKIIKGTSSSAPVRPTLKNTNTIVQIPLAYVDIDANATEITQSDITNMVGTDDCPFVTGILQTVSLGTLLGQWQEDFLAWFNETKGILDGDAAGNLRNYIDGKFQSVSITLSTEGWADNLQTVSVSGVTADKTKSDVFASPGTGDENYTAYNDSGVRLYAQLDNAVTFKCEDVPSIALTVSVFVRT